MVKKTKKNKCINFTNINLSEWSKLSLLSKNYIEKIKNYKNNNISTQEINSIYIPLISILHYNIQKEKEIYRNINKKKMLYNRNKWFSSIREIIYIGNTI